VSFVVVASCSSCTVVISPLCVAVQSGMTALHYATEKGHEAICSVLIASGADITTKDNVPLPLYTVNAIVNTQSTANAEVNAQWTNKE
jgi:ankyrin repeat protein